MTTFEQTSDAPSKTGKSTSSGTSKPAATASPKKRESKADKGLRYIREGRLTVTRVDGDRVVAECRGGRGEVYTLGFENGRWFCGCLARTDCSHLSALWRVTVQPR